MEVRRLIKVDPVFVFALKDIQALAVSQEIPAHQTRIFINQTNS